MRFEILFLSLIIFSALASADACYPNITLLNQDPYPAVPGEYVNLVFQVSNIQSSKCNDISVELVEKYPILLDPYETNKKTFAKVDYIRNFQSTILVPYKVRIDKNAVEGNNEIEFQVQSKGSGTITSKFDLEIKEVSVDFNVFVYNYDPKKSEVTFQILNIGKSNIEALTIEIPRQENIIIKGPNTQIVGDLDSKEYTTTNFEAQLQDGEITLNLFYTDEINQRRSKSIKIEFDSSYFTERFSENHKTPIWIYIIIFLVVAFVVYYFIKKIRKKKDDFEGV